MSKTNWIVLTLSTVVTVLPQLLEVFSPYPKVKVALSTVGVLAAAFLFQFRKQIDSPTDQK